MLPTSSARGSQATGAATCFVEDEQPFSTRSSPVPFPSLLCGPRPFSRFALTRCLLLEAGATRAESYNRWNEPPESMARPSVVAVLRAHGFMG